MREGMDEKKQDPIDDQWKDGRNAALIGYIPFLCFVPLLLHRDNDFVKSHGKQALLLLIVEVLALILMSPIGKMLWTLIFIVCLGVAFVGAARAFLGKPFKIPYIGDFADKL